MLKTGERKSIFDIANVIGNIRADLTIPPAEEVTITIVKEEVKEVESEVKKSKTKQEEKKSGTI